MGNIQLFLETCFGVLVPSSIDEWQGVSGYVAEGWMSEVFTV